MSDVIRRKAADVRASYSAKADVIEDAITFSEIDSDDYTPGAFGLNLKRYSQDGHSWNGRPYVCIDTRRF
jgi:hypothetical protein